MIRLAFRQAINRPCGVVLNFEAETVRLMLTAISHVGQRFVGAIDDSQSIFVTSGNDGVHQMTPTPSRHYSDDALDIGLRTFKSNEAIRKFRMELADFLGPAWVVLHENEDREGEHLHVQVRRGVTLPH